MNGRAHASDEPVVRPAADVIAGPKDLVITLDVPGVAADQLAVEVVDRELRVTGAPRGPVAGRPLLRERAAGTLERRFTLPSGIDPATISATFDDGVLSLLIPRPAAPAPQRIAVAAAQADRTPDRPRRSLKGLAEMVRPPSPGPAA